MRHPYARPALLYAAWLGMFFTLLAQSWVSEDTYITLRVVDQFMHGNGLRWNATERVQAYTHPLWLLLHLPAAAMWDNLFQVNIALSLLTASAAVALVLLSFRKSLPVTLGLFMLPLFLSKCFIDYAGSGLETALSYLLFAVLGYVLIHLRRHPDFLLFFSLACALLLFNRFDHAVLIGPLALLIAWQERQTLRRPRGMIMAITGALPLMLWCGFALIYYGFIFPNTKYAKLDTGFALSDYLLQGVHYGFMWLAHDTLSLGVTLAGIAFAFRSRAPVFMALAIGVICNLAYIIYIGGDYMMGRFFAVPFFAGAWLLLACSPQRMRPDIVFAAVLAMAVAFASSAVVRDIRASCAECIPVRGRVIDAKWTFRTSTLFTQYWPPSMRTQPDYKFRYEGEKLAKQGPQTGKVMRYVGMTPFYAGRDSVFIDEMGLADPLLARMPARADRGFYVGHYRRRIPRGYVQAVQTGSLENMEKNLAAYYSRLRLITQGDLWDRQRLMTILRFNFGQYERYKLEFLRAAR